ncbi:hypothetical protein BJX65DRAFT_270919 [Aspergillus insuetus]
MVYRPVSTKSPLRSLIIDIPDDGRTRFPRQSGHCNPAESTCEKCVGPVVKRSRRRRNYPKAHYGSNAPGNQS